MHSFTTLLRRELWEHTSLKGIPLILLAFVLLANFAFIYLLSSSPGILNISNGEEVRSLGSYIGVFTQMKPAQQTAIINSTMITTGMIINSVLLIVMFFYLLDSLYGERKDRTILFWKSLPVSNMQTVLSKLAIAVFVIPVIIFFTTALANFITLGLQSLFFYRNQYAVNLLWQQTDVTGLSLFSIFLLIQQTIWYFPVMGWLLFCSVWCRKPPIIVAVLIPVILVFIDSSFMLGTGISEILLERLPLGIMSMQLGNESSLMAYNYSLSEQQLPGFNMSAGISVPSINDILSFLMNVKVWMGLLIGFLFIGMAISLRRWRDDSL
ncbi:MAG: ABC transporter permease [Gammaproteobacteria bacterium]|nr:MAG: ABC transporter permease [Gammaproteobacteria bacterium]